MSIETLAAKRPSKKSPKNAPKAPARAELVNVAKEEAQGLARIGVGIERGLERLNEEWKGIKENIRIDKEDDGEFKSLQKPEEYWEFPSYLAEDILDQIEDEVEYLAMKLESVEAITREEDLTQAVKSFDRALKQAIKGAPSKNLEGKDDTLFVEVSKLLNKARDQVPGQLSKPSELTKLRDCFETISALSKRLLGSSVAVPKIPNALDPEDPRQLGFSFKAFRDAVAVRNITARFKASAIGYSDEELAILAMIVSLKPGYRAKELERAKLGPYNTENPDIKSLISKGLLKTNRSGAITAVQPKVDNLLKEEYVPEKYKYHISNPSFHFKSKEA
jgi:hypothetical protein